VSIEDGEKFLQEYMQNMGWKTKSRINETPRTKSSEGSDSEDEEFLEKVDQFETKYNFRFEEEGGHAISSHSRQVEDSVRVKDKKRKRERDQKKDRKEEDKKKKLIELQHLKNKKREEINRRLAEIEKVTGNKTSDENIGSVLETEFDPSTYDEEINQLLGND
jgi:protein KRI1